MTHSYNKLFINKCLFTLLRSTYSHHAFIKHKNIHQIHIETTFNMENHLGKTRKELFIWHEKYIAPFVGTLSLQTLLYILSTIYTEFFPLMLSILRYLKFSSPSPYCRSTHSLDQFSSKIGADRDQPAHRLGSLFYRLLHFVIN